MDGDLARRGWLCGKMGSNHARVLAVFGLGQFGSQPQQPAPLTLRSFAGGIEE
jgi:hypothetical protein